MMKVETVGDSRIVEPWHIAHAKHGRIHGKTWEAIAQDLEIKPSTLRHHYYQSLKAEEESRKSDVCKAALDALVVEPEADPRGSETDEEFLQRMKSWRVGA